MHFYWIQFNSQRLPMPQFINKANLHYSSCSFWWVNIPIFQPFTYFLIFTSVCIYSNSSIPAPPSSTFTHVSSPTPFDNPFISTLATQPPPPNSSTETLQTIIPFSFSDSIAPSFTVIKPTNCHLMLTWSKAGIIQKKDLLYIVNHRQTTKPLKIKIGVLLCKLSMQLYWRMLHRLLCLFHLMATL